MVKATHSGRVSLGGKTVECHVLDDGTHVLVAAQVQGILGAAKDRHLDRSLARLDHGSDDLEVRPIPFAGPTGEANGYTTEDVTKILRAYQRAFIRGTLHPKQKPIALAAMAAIESLADVGLRAMVAEASGYFASPSRPADDLQVFYSRIFRERMAAWEVCFDADWDKVLCRLYGQPYEGRPPLFVGNINAMVYRFAFGDAAYEELKRRNPEPRHKSNHHQTLTDEARILLSQTLTTVKSVARLSKGPPDFLRKLGVLYRNAPFQGDLW